MRAIVMADIAATNPKAVCDGCEARGRRRRLVAVGFSRGVPMKQTVLVLCERCAGGLIDALTEWRLLKMIDQKADQLEVRQ